MIFHESKAEHHEAQFAELGYFSDIVLIIRLGSEAICMLSETRKSYHDITNG